MRCLLHAAALARLVAVGEVTHLTAVPSVLSAMFEDHAGVLAGSRLRVVVSSGEVLTAGLVRTIRSVVPAVTIVNLYGSTEVSGDATALVIEPGAVVGERVPIGRPIPNARLYVVDGDGARCPVGVPGELWIGGMPVARGYQGDPAPTQLRPPRTTPVTRYDLKHRQDAARTAQEILGCWSE